MKWEDIKDSTELAEALSLFASLVAALIALRDAQKTEKESEDDASEEKADENFIETTLPGPELSVSADVSTVDKKIKRYLPSVVISLVAVVGIQMLILLFIAYKVL